MKWVSRGVHCVLWEGVKQGLGGEVLPGPGLFLHSLPLKTRDKAAPSRSCPGVWARWGWGMRLRAGWLTAFSCPPLPFSRGGPRAWFSSPPPLQKKRKIHGKSAAFLLPPPLTIRDASPVTGVSEKQGGPLRVLGRLEAVALTQRDTHCAAFRSPLS